MNNLALGFLWGIIFSVIAATVIVKTSPRPPVSSRTCETTLTDRAGWLHVKTGPCVFAETT